MAHRIAQSRRVVRTAIWQRVAIAFVVGLVSLLLVLGILLRRAPEFYRQEVARSAEEQRAASDQCLANMSATASQAQRAGRWRAEFTEAELNGWLAYDLPNNHPELAEGPVAAPRIDLADGVGQIAFEYRGLIKTYVLVEFDAEARDESTLAIRFRKLRGGALPMPMGALVEPLSSFASQLGQSVQWTEEEGLPVALVTFVPIDEGDPRVELRNVAILADRIVLEGETAHPHR